MLLTFQADNAHKLQGRDVLLKTRKSLPCTLRQGQEIDLCKHKYRVMWRDPWAELLSQHVKSTIGVGV